MSAPSLRGFSERVAVVSDAGNAFGRAVALQLALQGCYVIVGFAGESNENKSALTELQSIGTLASAVDADVSIETGVAHLFETVAATYGRLDLLINTARLESNADFINTNQTDFDQIVNHNLRAAFFCTQAAAHLMQNRPAAAIVNLTTENQSSALFAATQAAIIALTETLARQLAPKIRVNAVTIQHQETVQSQNTFELLRPLGAVAPDDAARAVLYLLSGEAAAITGQIISVGAKRARL